MQHADSTPEPVHSSNDILLAISERGVEDMQNFIKIVEALLLEHALSLVGKDLPASLKCMEGVNEIPSFLPHLRITAALYIQATATEDAPDLDVSNRN
ncbi:hypothetical protein [Aureimonas glaciei]|uniref:Uncharacterized protein n=1 Tax=Aureimonas glaciei TaxID=1776957 RepID=A0A916YB45_9HYPH|nr:hypothetical protein [Aureimonas glaciei]GGD38278.1 hypothetical protein GCM10011335_46260 [Aureimonas glaciei]